jgi:single-stranded-DNA-specific exonuclease
MKYKIINEELANQRDILSTAEIVLRNRGIDEPYDYTHTTDDDLHHYSKLDNIEEAKHCLLAHMEQGSRIGIMVDCDPDGYTSAAILYQYLSENYDKSKLEYFVHTGKQHGLSRDVQIPNTIQLLLIPDAATNDTDQCKELSERGVSIIILDHHECEQENPYAIIVNPQICDYPNKHLSGCAVVKKFLECLDDELWYDSSHYDDLVALSIISDSMSIKGLENKRLIDKGLSKIKNKLFLALLDKQSYSTGGKISINNIAFYITPLMNALIRSGSFEEKELMFRGFIETDETFPYKKRGETEETQEDIYTRIARLATNLKAKQGREVDKSLDLLRNKIKKHQWDDNKILFCDATEVDWSYTGLVTIKLANEYNRPCILIRESKEGIFSGSARNYGNSILNLKDYILNTGLFESAQGHNAAFGVSLKKENIKPAIEKINEDLKEIDMALVYMVDFEMDAEELTASFINDMNKLYDYYGQGVDESLVLVKNVMVNTKDIELMGKEKDTWKFSINDGECVIIKFKVNPEDNILKLISDDWGGQEICLNVIGKCKINCFQNIYTPQLEVLDFEII